VKPKRGDRQLLQVTRVEGGDGLAALGEYTVRVRGALPGDTVVARILRVQARRRLASARLLSIQSQTTERVPARCSHVGTCGGCIWQDVAYLDQLRIKQEAVRGCLDEAGIVTALDDPLPAAAPFFYRNKMEFSFGASPEGEVELGLHASGRFDRIFDLEACYLQSEVSNRIVDRVRRFVRDEDGGIDDVG